MKLTSKDSATTAANINRAEIPMTASSEVPDVTREARAAIT
jgi:hypothetical protein